MIRDAAGNFFVCVIGGSPGVWRKIGGPTTSGTLHNVTPFRAYDSRRAGYPVNGAMAMGTNRVVSIADAHDLATGNVTVANVVPAGATAVNYDLTVVAPTNTTGFTSLMPGDASTFTVASINWSVVGQTIANASTVPLDSGRQGEGLRRLRPGRLGARHHRHRRLLHVAQGAGAADIRRTSWPRTSGSSSTSSAGKPDAVIDSPVDSSSRRMISSDHSPPP